MNNKPKQPKYVWTKREQDVLEFAGISLSKTEIEKLTHRMSYFTVPLTIWNTLAFLTGDDESSAGKKFVKAAQSFVGKETWFMYEEQMLTVNMLLYRVGIRKTQQFNGMRLDLEVVPISPLLHDRKVSGWK